MRTKYVNLPEKLKSAVEYERFHGIEDGTDFYDISGKFITSIPDIRSKPYPRGNYQAFIIVGDKKKNVDVGDLVLTFHDGTRDVMTKDLFEKLFL